ncbi:PaaX family transcriptional regulator [Hoeflea prorocentri]|uniref:Phenylacetic acid degradation protein PaaX n=1 Tax=Hoeflea prorocentri TaxID=1922333 RepID=A0A9X3ZHA9_9HYPH|nr:PaaX family transcriptional regulator C-terminal domain-containing protein [Hoeflea prorocentri]MCY6380701.1 phenylacetic acid degradation protein PaaX [Hoeflea prorocentri]MDA5398501.1 phenylacetic acid degradation protein PaaX [Hoeflea prorocentri]
MSDSAAGEIEALVDGFHAQERIRVWSLVITVFGDAVIPRGGELWLGSLQDLMGRLRIEPTALRTAMSRLTADGWLTRSKIGRKSFYRLAPAGEEEFAQAALRIYGPSAGLWSGQWLVLVLSSEAGEGRDARRRQLRAGGFGALTPNVFIRPDVDNGAPAPVIQNGEFLFKSSLDRETDARSMVAQAWRLDEIEQSYVDFINRFARLKRALDSNGQLDPLSAMAARSLLIHHFRRLALRDPAFPSQLSPQNWPGDKARALAASIYGHLADPSEAWLDTCVNARDQAIAQPQIDIARRFAV